jgi:hypothetical protein
LAILAIYVAIGVIYTYPVLWKIHTGIASDPYDPILNTSILWWNATVVPFSAAWWNPLHFHPTLGAAAFTESLAGIGVIATPVYWLTGSALVAYNFAFFVSWPLSAFTAYLLAWLLVRRHDAAFLAGFAYGFSPYRTMELGHLQMLSVYWFPLVLLGLHGFLTERRGWWLVLFGVAWILQVLSNGYYLFFGAVLIGCWLLYFCARPRDWRVLPAIMTAWVAANLVLLPILSKYSTIQSSFGMRRTMTEAIAFSAVPRSWIDVAQWVWFWHKWLPESEVNLFPGITGLIVIGVGAVIAYRRFAHAMPQRGRGSWVAIAGLTVVLAISCAVMLAIVAYGPLNTSWLGIPIRINELDRAVGIALAAGLGLVLLLTPIRDAIARRSVFVFYVVAMVLTAVLATGPRLRTGEAVILEPMPYRWLMYLPGFDSVRVPNRFWMLGVLCLAMAAALAYARYGPRRPRTRQTVFAVAVAGLVLDCWTTGLPMPDAPVQWAKAERRDRVESVIELPLGPPYDAAATYRALRHRRRVVNGVSGYDPPFYAPLQDGLNSFDPSALVAMSAFGPIEVVVNGDSDPEGAWARYAASVAGEPILTDGTRRVYRLPFTPARKIQLGPTIPIASVSGTDKGAEFVNDGKLDTEWHDGFRQTPRQMLTADVGSVRDVGGVTMVLGEFARDFPRYLAIETSVDGASWTHAWEGGTVAMTMLAAIEAPRESPLSFSFGAHPARFVRLRTVTTHKNLWRVAELRVHGPTP